MHGEGQACSGSGEPELQKLGNDLCLARDRPSPYGNEEQLMQGKEQARSGSGEPELQKLGTIDAWRGTGPRATVMRDS